MTSSATTSTAERPVFGSLGEFVRDYLAPLYARQVSDTNQRVWCPRWWEHPEAVARLSAMWAAWEDLHTHGGPLGPSDWLLLHADRHMRELFDPDGPFKYCSPRGGHKPLLAPLPIDLEDIT